MTQPSLLLELNKLCFSYPPTYHLFRKKIPGRPILENISLNISKGQTLGLVGESGSGKSTLARCITRLLQPTQGQILFSGTDITTLSPKAMRPILSEMQMVFQDPVESLNPRLSVGEIIAEPYITHKIGTPAQRLEWTKSLLSRVGLPSGALHHYPFEFSGGQRQRIGIARALALNPKLLILDEPVSALDVSIQSQILNLLLELQEERKLTYLFISHDLRVIKHLADYTAVMNEGKIIEYTTTKELFKTAKHPYTQKLLNAQIPHRSIHF